MQFIVCSNNFDKYLEKWKLFASEHPSFNFILINDAGNKLSIASQINLSNITLIENQVNQGKVKSIISWIIENEINDWLFIMDDKDIIIDSNYLNEIKKMNLDQNYLYVSDNLIYKNNQIIGDIFPDDGSSLGSFYFKKGKIGDKFLLWNSEIILKNKNEYLNYLNFKNHIYETMLLIHLYDLPTKKLKPIFKHIYEPNGISNNNLKNKLLNPEYYIWESYYVLNKKPCFKVTIAKIFVLWWLRKNNIELKKISLKYRILYYLLQFTFMFYLIKKIYNRELKKVTQS